MASTIPAEVSTLALHQPANPPETACCIVGGGPAGAILALLLARNGVRVTLLEMHKDFDREFRGDTVHPSTLEILDQIGLAGRVHQLRHSKVTSPAIQTASGTFAPFDLSRLKTKFPYILMIPQKNLLELLTDEAARYPSFHLEMGANVTELIQADGVVRGVRYIQNGRTLELRAALTVGADGRFSRVRHLAGIAPVGNAPPMDVLWFRLPRVPDDPLGPGGAFGGIGHGHMVIGLDRGDYWQAGYVIPKGTYQGVRAEGIEGLRSHILEIVPQLKPHVEGLTDWRQVSLLSVESSRCPRWCAPGMLLIGDAAHVMSPLAGVGINYAVQDAVVAANLLTRPLLAGRPPLALLKAVQRKRKWPTRIIQSFQAQAQKRVVASALRSQQMIRIPWFVRFFLAIPYVRDLPARLIALGMFRVRVAPGLLGRPPIAQ
ncbi:MAG TPA: FAD-dependent oxidoreductase [Candidatus Acidoferrales bacterium]|nr:FAD-dependent oxidoreductase [Candidatus Acidoferrales bacterium]